MREPSQVNFPCPRRMREWLDNFRDWAISAQGLAGAGLLRSDSSGGRTFSVPGFGTLGGKSSSAVYPFLVTVASTPTTAKLGVRYGTVTDFINAPQSPAGMVVSNDPLYAVSVSIGNTVIYLPVEFETDLSDPDYGKIIQVDNPAVANALPANDYAGGNYYLPLRYFTVDGATTPPTITLYDQQASGIQGFKLSGESGLFGSLGV